MNTTLLRENLKLNPIIVENLARLLYTQLNQIESFDESISFEDCYEYLYSYTVTGYYKEISTIYGQLQEILGVPIVAAEDKWDRLYNVDFFIQVSQQYIGLQIKPVNSGIQLPQIHKEHNIQMETHTKFSAKYGGKVFYIFSAKVGNKKEIQNKEVIEEIRQEIVRLSSL